MDTTIDPSPRPRLRSPRAVLHPQRLGRCLIGGLAAVCVAGATVDSAGATSNTAHVQATQELAVLLTAHGTHRAPDAGSPQSVLMPARRPITGEQTTLPVIARSIGAGGVRWLDVMLPGRPNGSTGWIAQQGTRPLVTPWRIVVDLAARRVSLYGNGRMARSFQAVVGKPSTPTPTGRFFVEEMVQMQAGEAGGPYALALSARSNVLREFEGGPGQIGIHGRDNLGGTLGTAASHGCVRVATASIDWLAARIGPGTPVTIDG
ncbi:MAG TPA: L,D-transpeptidase [Solirubrobacteraceae bacterium]|jgi:lipoprotein-anchoring transpeptidase ErfK/SrfK|nr:L,D-transpeptidase [Solirubrobacteraceae bacterium]